MVSSFPAQPIATRPIETSAGVFAAASRAKGNARIVETRQDWRGGGAIAGAELPSLAEGRGPLIDLCLACNELFYFARTDARKNAKEKHQRKKEAERRETQIIILRIARCGRAPWSFPAPLARGQDPEARTPSGVPPRLLPKGLSSLRLSVRPGFLGLGRSARS